MAGWLAGIIVNLLTYAGFYDVTLRDFGLLVAALALAVLAGTYTKPGFRKGGMKSPCLAGQQALQQLDGPGLQSP